MEEKNGYGGNCFDSSLKWMLENGTPNYSKNTTVTLVHGYVVGKAGPHEGEKYSHAWVEVELNGVPIVICIDTATGISVLKETYYELGRIIETECFRYSYSDVLERVANGEYAPFDLPRSEYELTLLSNNVVDEEFNKIK